MVLEPAAQSGQDARVVGRAERDRVGKDIGDIGQQQLADLRRVLLLVDDVAGFLVFGLLSLLWLQLKRAGVLQPTRIGSYNFILK